MEHNVFSDITPDIVRLADLSRQAGIIEQELFTKYEVKRGLRDLNGKGVLAGLTTIPAIVRELSDDAAIVAMVDANIQRSI